jgi:hypothetical protein
MQSLELEHGSFTSPTRVYPVTTLTATFTRFKKKLTIAFPFPPENLRLPRDIQENFYTAFTKLLLLINPKLSRCQVNIYSPEGRQDISETCDSMNGVQRCLHLVPRRQTTDENQRQVSPNKSFSHSFELPTLLLVQLHHDVKTCRFEKEKDEFCIDREIIFSLILNVI